MWQLEERKASAFSKNGKRKNQKGSLPMPPKGGTPKPRFYRVDHWFLEDNDSAEVQKETQPVRDSGYHSMTQPSEANKTSEKERPILVLWNFISLFLVNQVRGWYGREYNHQFHFSFSFWSSPGTNLLG